MRARLRLVVVGALLVAACGTPAADSEPTADASVATLTEADPAPAHPALSKLRQRVRLETMPPDQSQPPSAPRVERVAVLPKSVVTSFEFGDSTLRPELSKASGLLTATVEYPAVASGSFRVTDDQTGAAIDVALRGADEVRAETSDGYVLYPFAFRGSTVLHRPGHEGTEDYIAFDEPAQAGLAEYDVALAHGIAGLRMIERTLEMVDSTGTPRLRLNPPYVVGADGSVHDAQIHVEGCAYDTNPAAPWGRAVTSPGSSQCVVRVTWDAESIEHPAVLDPSWTTTGSMSASRYIHRAGLLQNGRVLVAGGYSGGYLATAQVYDPATGTWSPTGSMPRARAYFAMETLNNGKVLAAGGYNSTSSYLAAADLYDPVAGSWSATAAMASSRYVPASVKLADGRVLISGGYSSSSGYTATAEIYDASGATRSNAGSMSAGRNSHAMSLLASGRALVSGGYTTSPSTTYLSSSQTYDPTTNTWTAVGPMPSGRSGHLQVVLPNGNVLAAGGYNSSSTYLSSAALFSPSSNTWATTGNMTMPRSAHTLTLVGGSAMAAGGLRASSTPTNSAELFNPASGTWTVTASMSSARNTFTATLLSSEQVLVAGGHNGSAVIATAELYNFAAACTTQSDCSGSTFCVDGFCCNTACTGGCDRCNLAGFEGTCRAVSAGTAGVDPPCDPFACDGINPTCPSSCTSNTQCASGYHCAAGSCIPNLPQGSVCVAAGDCQSGYCADGFCCNAACSGGCDVCSASLGAAADGVCTPVTGLGSPSCSPYVCSGTIGACPSTCTSDASCIGLHYCSGSTCTVKRAQGQTCTAANQCASGFCVDGYCCANACANACDRCNISGSLGSCVNALANTAGNPACDPYQCSGTSTSCPTSCTTDTNCVSGYFCSSGQCVAKYAQGQACATPNQCSSGYCVDGYCCNSTCAGGCNVCDAASGATANGQCTNITGAGYPSCAPYACSGSSASCPSSCTSSAQCATGLICYNNGCVAKFADGTSCTSSGQCVSGSCTDGYCCDSACSNGCDRCDLVGLLGKCTAVGAGNPGYAPSCSPYLCNGSTPACPTSCTSDSNCAAGNYCSSGVCTAKLTNGFGCTAGTQCVSGNCVDGFCCNSTCVGACNACAASMGASSNGTCSNVAGPGSPSCSPFACSGVSSACPSSCSSDSQCASTYTCISGNCVTKLANGSSCGSASNCQSGFCADGYCCNSACSGGCDACSVAAGASANGVCSVVSGPGAPSCAPYVCNGTLANCPSSCSSDASCAAGSYCSSGSCIAKAPNGTVCNNNGQCTSGQCVDGICCNAACNGGSCDRCDLPGSVGTCIIAGLGNLGSPSCGSYACNGSSAQCPTTCSSSAECSPGNYCNGGSCVPKDPNGTACASGNNCASGLCADGRCCNTACTGGCDRCDVANKLGTCTAVAAGTAGVNPTCGAFLCDGINHICPTSCTSDGQCSSGLCVNGQCISKQPNGAVCTAANQCTSGFCADGVCCNSACTGQCEACNQPSLAGACSPVQGAPVGGRPACTSDGTSCGGTCNGVTKTACTYPGATMPCAASSCSGGVAQAASACNAAGACTPGTTVQCAPYACGTTWCLTSCSTELECAPGANCEAGKCIGALNLGESCDASGQCGSGFCVDGVCCEAECNGQCAACNLPGLAGSCSAVSGSPVGSRPACDGSGACAGNCDGTTLTSCAYPSAATQCAPATCAGSVATTAATCDGKGDCTPGSTTQCGPQGCAGSTCAGTDAAPPDAAEQDAPVTEDGPSTSDGPADIDADNPDGSPADPISLRVAEPGGCGCRTTGNSSSTPAFAALALGLAVALRRNRRKAS